MIQTCNICGKKIETGGFGGLPMKQHYKNKHPDKYYTDKQESSDNNQSNHKITGYIGE